MYLDRESPSAQRQLDDLDAFLTGQRNRLVILDEVQRLPEVFAVLRGVIDQRRRAGEAAGQFLLLGSFRRARAEPASMAERADDLREGLRDLLGRGREAELPIDLGQ